MCLNFLLTGLLSLNIYGWGNLTQRSRVISLRMTHQLKGKNKDEIHPLFRQKRHQIQEMFTLGRWEGRVANWRENLWKSSVPSLIHQNKPLFQNSILSKSKSADRLRESSLLYGVERQSSSVPHQQWPLPFSPRSSVEHFQNKLE